ncbi:chemotaxis protein CheW [bacterium]|nr:chemotaxis protein CheW [bacterium]
MDNVEYDELFSAFMAELEVRAANIQAQLVQLSEGVSPDVLMALLREAHNIKGSALIVELNDLADLAQQFENVISALQKATIRLDHDLISILTRGIEFMLLMVQERTKGIILDVSEMIAQLRHCLKKDQPETFEDQSGDATLRSITHPTTQAAVSIDVDEKVLISARQLDFLMELASELRVCQVTFDHHLRNLDRIEQSLNHYLILNNQDIPGANQLTFEVAIGNGNTSSARKKQESLDLIIATQHELKNTIKDLTLDNRNLMKDSNLLQETMKRTRMLPLARLFAGFDKMVHDLALSQGKKINFNTKGEQILIDKKILEKIQDPLIHIIRNAIDHGIEFPEQRRRCLKEETGEIRVTAEQIGHMINITIEDDGAGINRTLLLEKALEKGIVTSGQEDELTPNDILSLVFASGVSTCARVTEISGRGIGMDVVKRNIDALQGSVDVQSRQDEGTTITIRVPLTLATSKILIFKVAGQTMAIPSLAVKRIIRLSKHDQSKDIESQTLLLGGMVIPRYNLMHILNLDGTNPPRAPDLFFQAIVIKAASQIKAYTVDEIIGEQEVIIKNIGEQNSAIHCVSGATVLGNGELIVILNPIELLACSAQYDYSHQKT